MAPAVGPAEVEQLVPDGVHTLLRLKNGSLASRYLYGPAVDQILADEQLDPATGQTDRLLWPLTDNLGTVRDVAEFEIETTPASPASLTSRQAIFSGRIAKGCLSQLHKKEAGVVSAS